MCTRETQSAGRKKLKLKLKAWSKKPKTQSKKPEAKSVKQESKNKKEFKALSKKVQCTKQEKFNLQSKKCVIWRVQWKRMSVIGHLTTDLCTYFSALDHCNFLSLSGKYCWWTHSHLHGTFPFIKVMLVTCWLACSLWKECLTICWSKSHLCALAMLCHCMLCYIFWNKTAWWEYWIYIMCIHVYIYIFAGIFWSCASVPLSRWSMASSPLFLTWCWRLASLMESSPP